MLAGFILTSLMPNGWGWAAPLVGLIIGGMLGMVLYLVLFGPLLKRGFLIAMTASLAAAFIVTGVAQVVWGVNTLSISPIIGGTTLLPGGVLTNQQVATLVITALAFLIIVPVIQWTSIGRVMRAVADNPAGASCIGINPRRVHVLAALLGGAAAGLAAAMLVPQQGVSITSADDFALYAISGAILGGLGSTWGAAAGGLVLGIVGGLATGYAPDWYEVLEFGIVLLILRVYPRGIMGGRAVT
jgi:branched-subunit amino acid ABC-type transport system permease component